MQAVLEPRSFEGASKPSIVTLGVFDGVHVGHLTILRETIDWAKSAGLQSAVITFRRHPDSLLKGQTPPAITSLEHRLLLLERLGIDLTLVLNFDDAVRNTTAEEFCRDWFVKCLKARGVLLGPDSALGRDREGTPEKLREIGKKLGFEVRQAKPALLHGKIVSSTAIREALQRGDLKAAGEMLGRTPSIYGTVIHGDDRGHRIGVPTANLNLHHEFTPGRGVYFGWTEIEGKKVYCLVNIGRRPTFKEEEPHDIAEAHLLDFKGQIYGSALEITLLERFRDEMKFPSAEALKVQIEKDVARARKLM